MGEGEGTKGEGEIPALLYLSVLFYYLSLLHLDPFSFSSLFFPQLSFSNSNISFGSVISAVITLTETIPRYPPHLPLLYPLPSFRIGRDGRHRPLW